MAKILWLNWSGGGNLPPSLGVAKALEARGHAVSFAGRPEMVPRVKTAGFRAIEFTRAYEQVDLYPQGSFLTRMSCYLTSPAVEDEVRSVVAAEAPDVAVIDAMFPAALAQSPGFRAPTAVFVHTFVFRQLDMWRGMFARLDGMRRQAGFDGLPELDALWGPRDLIVSTSSRPSTRRPTPAGTKCATPARCWKMSASPSRPRCPGRNDVIAASTAIWRERPETAEERRAWLVERQSRGFPVLVAVDPTGVLGFSSYAGFRSAEGYRHSVEHSVHVRGDTRGQGVGTA